MEVSILIQYILLAVILVIAIAYVVNRFFRKQKGNKSCSGCALSDACNKKKTKLKNSNKEPKE